MAPGLQQDGDDGVSLNESPSEKEGKSGFGSVVVAKRSPSMKVPPKRKGNPKPRPHR